MASHSPLPSEDRALAQVVAGASPAFNSSKGFSSVSQVATGRHRLTLSQPIPQANMIVTLGRQSSAAGSIGFVLFSTTEIDVYTLDATPAAADVNFTICVERVP